MIPTAIFFGLIGGLIPRYRWWSIPVIGAIWSIMLTLEGDPTMSFAQIWFAGFVFGALNGAVGVLVSWAFVHLLTELFRWMRAMWSHG
jgi:hypothetical protein